MNKENITFEILRKKVNVKNILIGALLITILVLVIAKRVSHASFTSSIDVPLVNGKINYKHPDFKMVSMHVQDSSDSSTYNETNEMPSGSEYVINSSKSYCNKGFTEEKDTGVVLKTVNGNHVMNNLTKNDRCFLYFDVASLTVSDILAKYTKSTSRSGEITAAFTESTPTTVYSAPDDGGTSYVFAGVNPNNWVKIGNLYFRIIRFNGNGSMRLIYSGSGSAQTSGTGTEIGKRSFNSSWNDNMYAGLQYTSGSVHGSSTNSTILGETNSTDTTTLYGWYNNNIKTTYGTLIDSTVGFCSDRDNYTDADGTMAGGGTGTTKTWYGAYMRFKTGNVGTYKTTFTPTLKCKEASDLLKLPVGLITADEYMLAGGGTSVSGYYNTNMYLHTGQNYWTMSPQGYASAGYIYMFYAGSFGGIVTYSIDDAYGVRPVINLKSTTTFSSGTGTSSNPYTVSV